MKVHWLFCSAESINVKENTYLSAIYFQKRPLSPNKETIIKYRILQNHHFIDPFLHKIESQFEKIHKKEML